MALITLENIIEPNGESGGTIINGEATTRELIAMAVDLTGAVLQDSPEPQEITPEMIDEWCELLKICLIERVVPDGDTN